MGWTFKHGATRKQVIEDITRGWQKNGRGVRFIAKQYKGAPFKGVLYAVGQPFIEGEEDPNNRFILVVLLEYVRGEWGYKDMDESMHPYYYGCPKKYLNMVPKVACQEWRDNVMAYWENQKKKREQKKRQRKAEKNRSLWLTGSFTV